MTAPSLEIKMFPCLFDNYGFLIHDAEANLTATIDTPEVSAIQNALAEEIKKAKEQGQPDFGNTYYQFWLSALETILLEKNILKKSDLKSMMEQWRRAYLSTPHGNPVKLVKYK